MAVDRKVRFGDWLVSYDDATQDVTITRNAIDILGAKPGDALDCMNSRCIRAQRNAHCFPHPVYMVSTIKTRVYIVDCLNDAGEPVHAIRYEVRGRNRRLIDQHDRGAGEVGDLMLHVPADPKGSPKRAASSQEGRFAFLSGRHSGVGKRTRPARPTKVVGAEARYLVAVGALREASEGEK